MVAPIARHDRPALPTLGMRFEFSAPQRPFRMTQPARSNRVGDFSRRIIFPLLGVCGLLVVVFGACWTSAPSQFAPSSRAATADGHEQISVPSNGDLQAALDEAKPGDTIVLTSGATYRGHFKLPNKPGDEYITIRSSERDSLPPEGSRVSPADAPHMARLISPDAESVVTATHGAHHYRFIGLEFQAAPRVYMGPIISDGLGSESSLADLPHDLVFDRDYVHGDPDVGTKRGIGLNGGLTTVENCYISDIKSTSQDSQALGGYNGPGPYHIINNYLEASGENVMFGGATPAIVNGVPSDIEIRHNYFRKPLSWRIGDPSYAGTPWVVKNLFELKRARRVLVDGNLFENNWPHAQSGFAIGFTVRTDNGAVPWGVIEDITFTHNIIRHSACGLNITGHDDNGEGRGRNFLIKDNLLVDISRSRWGSDGKDFQILSGTDGVVIDHNTVIGDGQNYLILGGKLPQPNFVFRNNIVPNGQYGMWNQMGKGPPAEAKMIPGAIITDNVLVQNTAGKGNPGWDAVRFLDFAHADYRLAPNSRYRGQGTDGKDLGADIGAILQATAGVEKGR